MAFKKKIRGKQSRYYYVDFWIGQQGDPAAIHVNKSTRSADYQEACKIEEQWKVDTEEKFFKLQGDLHNLDDICLSQALELVWKKRWKFNKCGDRSYDRILKIMEITGDVPLSELYGRKGYFLIDKVRDTLVEEEGRKTQTVDNYLSDMRMLLNATQEHLQLFDVTVPTVKLFRSSVRRTRTLSEDEEIKLFRYADQIYSEYSQLFRVLLDTGMRLSEPLAMNYQQHIFLKERKIMLTPDITKTSRVRSVPMTKRVHRILTELMQTNPVKPFSFTQVQVSKIFKNCRVAIGFTDDKQFVTHMLRHSCTTRLLQQGVNKATVQTWLGHSSEIMTDHYSHLVVEDMRFGAELLDKLTEQINSISPEPV